MFPQQIVEELLSVAHVQAVAARSEVSISNFDKDFGVDGMLPFVRLQRLVIGDLAVGMP